MGMSKLTLSIDPAVISRAKRYAKQHGTSVSQMVEAYLTSVSTPRESTELPPILRALRGTLKHADLGDYRKYLSGKYRRSVSYWMPISFWTCFLIARLISDRARQYGRRLRPVRPKVFWRRMPSPRFTIWCARSKGLPGRPALSARSFGFSESPQWMGPCSGMHWNWRDAISKTL
jgi:hypothetical protein